MTEEKNKMTQKKNRSWGFLLYLPAVAKGLFNTLLHILKLLAVLFFYIWVRWTLPRFRYDQLMKLGWKTLIPLALLNIVLTGVVVYLLSGTE